ncbi:hypothetical protein NDU88_004470 [Pleurodeles waltl]|uniref:Uncharacterized protein n=1 Tax=Pleurodeles waltl TaxID=8319 RepID=A0AAV7TSN1_PLEWA|nr:hypothetical protein NDU88_004470 [Pleurodeles waltl]
MGAGVPEAHTYRLLGVPQSKANAAPGVSIFQIRSARVLHSAITRQRRAPRTSHGPDASLASWAAPSGLCALPPPLCWFRNWGGWFSPP